MKRAGFIILATVMILVMAGGIYWMEINIVPTVSLPKTSPTPSPNAYDIFLSASKLAWYGPDDEVDGMGTPTPAQMRAILRRNLPVIAMVRTGFPYPYLEPPTIKYPGMKAVDDADVLAFAGKVYAEQRDWANAIRCDLDAVQVGQQVMQSGTIGDVFHGDWAERRGLRRMWDVVDHLNRQQTVAALARLEQIESRKIPYDRALEAQKWRDEEGLLQLFHRHDWRRSSGTLANYVPLYLSSDRAIMNNEIAYNDAWIKEVRKPYAARLPLPAVPGDAWHSMENAQDTPYGTPAPGEGALGYFRTEEWFWYTQNRAAAGMMAIALALHAYKLDHGAYPDRLAELAPSYLKSVPPDPFAASGPLRYRRAGDSYVLYSVGPDGKDDGGKPIFQALVIAGMVETKPSYNVIEMDSKGDIVAGVNNLP